MAEKVLLALLGSGNAILFLRFLIERYDEKHSVVEQLTKLEKDVLRTQLLLLVLMKPDEKQEILTIAEHYFADLKGNWYMTSIFNKWLAETGIADPDWFDAKQD